MKSQEDNFKEALDVMKRGLKEANVSLEETTSTIGALAIVEIARQLCRIAEALEAK